MAPKRICRPAWRTPVFWKENYGLVLAAITLLAMLTGWIGGEIPHDTPLGSQMCAVTAFAGGYSGVSSGEHGETRSL